MELSAQYSYEVNEEGKWLTDLTQGGDLKDGEYQSKEIQGGDPQIGSLQGVLPCTHGLAFQDGEYQDKELQSEGLQNGGLQSGLLEGGLGSTLQGGVIQGLGLHGRTHQGWSPQNDQQAAEYQASGSQGASFDFGPATPILPSEDLDYRHRIALLEAFMLSDSGSSEYMAGGGRGERLSDFAIRQDTLSFTDIISELKKNDAAFEQWYNQRSRLISSFTDIISDLRRNDADSKQWNKQRLRLMEEVNKRLEKAESDSDKDQIKPDVEKLQKIACKMDALSNLISQRASNFTYSHQPSKNSHRVSKKSREASKNSLQASRDLVEIQTNLRECTDELKSIIETISIR